MAIIVDASVALSWLFADEFSEAAHDLFEQAGEQGVLVPSHWPLEIVNGALMGERRGRVLPSAIERWAEQIGNIDAVIDTQPMTWAFDALMPLCRTHRLTSYDAAYLELSARSRTVLATFDGRLAQAAREIGVAVYPDRLQIS
jgi:predicted nucleic acid-binding protein